MTIHYIVGDATEPVDVPGCVRKMIVHVCNDIGAWGAGFSGAISKKYPEAESYFRTVFKGKYPTKLGRVQWVWIKEGLTVVNMIAQHKLISHYKGTKEKPIRYEALKSCLEDVNSVAVLSNSSVHMPRIGCGLAGGKWEEVEKIINETMPDIQVYVYDL